MFNGLYAAALSCVAKELREVGIVLVIKCCRGKPFWASCSDEERIDEQTVVEATFVDDEVLALVAATPRLLDKAVDALLRTVYKVFACFALSINNWKKVNPLNSKSDSHSIAN